MANQILHYPETFGYRTYPAKNEIVTSIDANSTNNQIPTAKAVYDFDKHNKGYFSDYDELKSAYPTAEIGDYALVLDTDTIWFWDGADWIDSDKKGQVSSVGGLTGAVGVVAVAGTCITVESDEDNNEIQISANINTTIASDDDDTTLPTSKAVVDYAVPIANINTTQTEGSPTSSTVIPSKAYVDDLISTLEKAVTYTTPVPIHVAPVSAQTPALVTPSQDYDNKACDVVVTPTLGNVGPVYITTTSTYSNLNPIYPDPTNNYYKFPNSSSIYIAVDNVGDSVDLTISYRG